MWESRAHCLHKSEQNPRKWPYLDSNGTLHHAQRYMGIYAGHFRAVRTNVRATSVINKGVSPSWSALTSSRMLRSSSLSRSTAMPSWGQLSGAWHAVRVREFVPGQNLSVQEPSDHTLHAPGAGPTTGPGVLARRDVRRERGSKKGTLIQNRDYQKWAWHTVNLMRIERSHPYE